MKANRGPRAGPANRRALIAAAREVFSTEGISAPLSSVARLAGVGQGSLYRHFPDRIALAVAVFDENIGDLERAVETSNGTIDDLLTLVLEQALVSTALIDTITAHADDERVSPLGERLSALVDTVVSREKAAGRLGAHVEVDDVVLAISMLAGVLARSEPADRPAVGSRAWALFHLAFTAPATAADPHGRPAMHDTRKD